MSFFGSKILEEQIRENSRKFGQFPSNNNNLHPDLDPLFGNNTIEQQIRNSRNPLFSNPFPHPDIDPLIGVGSSTNLFDPVNSLILRDHQRSNLDICRILEAITKEQKRLADITDTKVKRLTDLVEKMADQFDIIVQRLDMYEGQLKKL